MAQAEVVIYTLPGCGACLRARSLLRRRDIGFHEISGVGVSRFRGMLMERTGRATVPQIVIDGEPVGGGGCGPWRYEVALVDRDGRRLESTTVGSHSEGEAMLEAMLAASAGELDPRGAAEIHPTSPPNRRVAAEREAG